MCVEVGGEVWGFGVQLHEGVGQILGHDDLGGVLCREEALAGVACMHSII